MRTNCTACNTGGPNYLCPACAENAPRPTLSETCEWCGADNKDHADLCPPCTVTLKTALRIAQAAYAKRQSFRRLDD